MIFVQYAPLLIKIFLYEFRDLMRNRIKGSIPPELGNLKAIIRLWVGRNSCRILRPLHFTWTLMSYSKNLWTTNCLTWCLYFFVDCADFWTRTNWRGQFHQNLVNLRVWIGFSLTRTFSTAQFLQALLTSLVSDTCKWRKFPNVLSSPSSPF